MAKPKTLKFRKPKSLVGMGFGDVRQTLIYCTKFKQVTAKGGKKVRRCASYSTTKKGNDNAGE